MGWLWFTLTVVIFGSMEVISKPFMGLIDPFALTLMRFILGLFFLLSFNLIYNPKSLKNIAKSDIALMAFLGFLNTFFSMSMLQMAVHHTTAATTALIFSSNPIFVLLLAFITGRERFDIGKVIAFIIGISGLFLLMFKRGGFDLHVGALYALIAAVSFALYTFLNKGLVSRVHPVTVNVISFSFGILWLLAYVLIARIPVEFAPIMASTTAALRMLYLGLIVSGVGYITFFFTLRAYSASAASLIFMLKPAVATLLSYMLLSEVLDWRFFIGLFLILGGTGIYFGIKKKERQVAL